MRSGRIRFFSLEIQRQDGMALVSIPLNFCTWTFLGEKKQSGKPFPESSGFF